MWTTSRARCKESSRMGELRRTMSGNAVRAVQDRDWGVAVQQFWDSSPE